MEVEAVVADTCTQMVVVEAMSVVAVAVVAAVAVFLTVAAPVAVMAVAVAAELQMCLADGHVSPSGYASCACVCPPCGCVGSSSSARLRCRCRCHLPSGVPTRAASARSSDLQRSRHPRPCGATLRRCRQTAYYCTWNRKKCRKSRRLIVPRDDPSSPLRHVFSAQLSRLFARPFFVNSRRAAKRWAKGRIARHARAHASTPHALRLIDRSRVHPASPVPACSTWVSDEEGRQIG